MDKIRSFITENGKKVGLGVAVAVAVGAGAYFLSRGSAGDDRLSETNTNVSANHSFVGHFQKSEKYWKTVEELKTVLSQTNGQIPSAQVMLILIRISIELYRSRFSQIYIQNRNQRRAVIRNPAEYSRKVREGNELGEKLYEDATNEVLGDIGVSREHFDQKLDETVRIDNRFAAYVSYLYSQVKVQIGNSDTAVVPTTDQMIRFFKAQSEELDKNTIPNFSIADPAEEIVCKQAYLADLASLKVGVEEEDIGKDLSVFQNPEVQAAHVELQEKMQAAGIIMSN